MLKKLTAKQSWFKSKPESDKTDERDRQSRVVDKGESGHGRERNMLELSTTFKKSSQPPTVLFCEYSRGGCLQSRLKEVTDRLSSLVGFRMRVTERGGTKLGSLLSNKNLWSGVECGRMECRVCSQPGDKKEDCVRRNVLYE